MQLHHIDFNKKNYNIDNLELVNQSDHFKIHAGWIRKNGKWIKKPCKECKKLLPLNNFYFKKTINNYDNNCINCRKRITDRESRKKGISKKRYIIPNNKGEYQCLYCKEWKKIDLFPTKKNKPKSYCKKCFNILQKKWREAKLKKSVS